jgi:hypothetical protein
MKAALVLAFAAGFALAPLNPMRSAPSLANSTLVHELTENLPDEYFPISAGGTGGHFGSIHAQYGALQADQEMCGFTIPEKVKTFIEADLRTFSSDEQSSKIQLSQQSRSLSKESYADALKHSDINSVCALQRSVQNYILILFPENETRLIPLTQVHLYVVSASGRIAPGFSSDSLD